MVDANKSNSDVAGNAGSRYSVVASTHAEVVSQECFVLLVIFGQVADLLAIFESSDDDHDVVFDFVHDYSSVIDARSIQIDTFNRDKERTVAISTVKLIFVKRSVIVISRLV